MTSLPVNEYYDPHQDEVLLAEDEAAITTTNNPQSLVVQHLQHQLANAIVLFLQYKSCGWQAKGIAFANLRLTFESFATQTKGFFDQIGDRLRMIGQDPDLLLESLIDNAGVKQSANAADYMELLAQADANAITVIREIRDAIQELKNDDEDPGSLDLLHRILRGYEEHEWHLRQLVKSMEG